MPCAWGNSFGVGQRGRTCSSVHFNAVVRLDPLSCTLRLVLLGEHEKRIALLFMDHGRFAVDHLWLLNEWKHPCRRGPRLFFNRATARNPSQRSPVRGLGERPTDA